MIIDMHIHTVASGNSLIAAEDLIDQALDLGLDGICVTELNSYAASAVVEEFAEGTPLKVFRGVEAVTKEGHLLIYGVRDDQWRSYLEEHQGSAQRLIDYVRAIDGVAVPAHPFDPIKPSVGGKLSSLAGIFALEGCNGQAEAHDNRRAQAAAEQFDLKVIGGSDASRLSEVGRCVTEFETDITTMAELVSELKAGRFQGRYL